jgi:hypothetical protein
MNEYVAGATSVVDLIFLQDSASTTGGGKAGLAYNTASLTCYYKRSNGTASVAVTLADITTLGTYVSGGFKAVDGTNMPGCYEFHPPDAAFATGAKEVTFFFQGATGLAPRPIKYRILGGVNPDDAVRAGLTALPNVASGSAGAILTSGTGTAQLSVSGGIADANAKQLLGTTLTEGAAGRLKAAFTTLFDVASPVLTTASVNQTGDAFARIGAAGAGLTALGDARIAHLDADVTSRLAPTVAGRTLALTGTTISTGQAVASVSGAVGSVTGSVGSIGSGGIDATSFTAGAINAAAIATDALGSLELASSAVTEIVNAVWNEPLPGLYGAGTAAAIVGTNLNATVGSRSSHSAADVWAVATRVLTAGTNIALAKGTGVTGFTDLDAAGVRTAVGLAVANLDTQLATIAAYIDTEVAAIKVVTDKIASALQSDGAGGYQYTVLALANAPSGGGGGGGATMAQIFDTASTIDGGTFREAMRAVAAALAGNLAESADHTATTIKAFKAPATTRITATNTGTTRTVTNT